MARKKKYKKVYKGVRYITRALGKYWPKRYPNYQERQVRARAIFNQLQTDNNRVILANIFPIERVPRGTRPEQFQLPEDLAEPRQYWELVEYPHRIISLPRSSGITFISDVSPAGLDPIKAGEDVEFDVYFADFVSYSNKLKTLSGNPKSPIPWNVMCTPPDAKGVSKIIPCTDTEPPQYFDYGFNPQDPTANPPGSEIWEQPEGEPPAPGEPPGEPPTTPGEPSPAQIRSQELELQRQLSIERQKELEGLSPADKFKLLQTREQHKQQNISTLLKMFAEGKISKSEYKDMARNV